MRDFAHETDGSSLKPLGDVGRVALRRDAGLRGRGNFYASLSELRIPCFDDDPSILASERLDNSSEQWQFGL